MPHQYSNSFAPPSRNAAMLVLTPLSSQYCITLIHEITWMLVYFTFSSILIFLARMYCLSVLYTYKSVARIKNQSISNTRWKLRKTAVVLINSAHSIYGWSMSTDLEVQHHYVYHDMCIITVRMRATPTLLYSENIVLILSFYTPTDRATTAQRILHKFSKNNGAPDRCSTAPRGQRGCNYYT